VIVSKIMDAVTGKTIENAATVGGEKFGSGATVIANVHLEQLEEPDPVWIHGGFILLFRLDIAEVRARFNQRGYGHCACVFLPFRPNSEILTPRISS